MSHPLFSWFSLFTSVYAFPVFHYPQIFAEIDKWSNDLVHYDCKKDTCYSKLKDKHKQKRHRNHPHRTKQLCYEHPYRVATAPDRIANNYVCWFCEQIDTDKDQIYPTRCNYTLVVGEKWYDLLWKRKTDTECDDSNLSKNPGILLPLSFYQ